MPRFVPLVTSMQYRSPKTRVHSFIPRLVLAINLPILKIMGTRVINRITTWNLRIGMVVCPTKKPHQVPVVTVDLNDAGVVHIIEVTQQRRIISLPLRICVLGTAKSRYQNGDCQQRNDCRYSKYQSSSHASQKTSAITESRCRPSTSHQSIDSTVLLREKHKVRLRRFELPRDYLPLGPQPSASANSATAAGQHTVYEH